MKCDEEIITWTGVEMMTTEPVVGYFTITSEHWAGQTPVIKTASGVLQ
jgi:hypothetical protein